MRVKNKTRYDTRTLRKLYRWCMDKAGLHDGRYVVLTVDYNRARPGESVHGEASIGNPWTRMEVPHGWFCTHSFARVAIHEIGHNLGLRHREMLPVRQLDVSDLPAEFGDAMRERSQAQPGGSDRPKPDTVAVRFARCLKKLAEWESKVKRAKGKVGTYKRKVAYYERKYPAERLRPETATSPTTSEKLLP